MGCFAALIVCEDGSMRGEGLRLRITGATASYPRELIAAPAAEDRGGRQQRRSDSDAAGKVLMAWCRRRPVQTRCAKPLHLGDLHLAAEREPRLSSLSTRASA